MGGCERGEGARLPLAVSLALQPALPNFLPPFSFCWSVPWCQFVIFSTFSELKHPRFPVSVYVLFSNGCPEEGHRSFQHSAWMYTYLHMGSGVWRPNARAFSGLPFFTSLGGGAGRWRRDRAPSEIRQPQRDEHHWKCHRPLFLR